MKIVSLSLSIAFFLLTSSADARSLGTCHDSLGYYLNSSHQLVHRPECSSGHLSGETAICRDGSHSFSRHRRGTCSHHGGVAQFE
jgi:hypothetical protein